MDLNEINIFIQVIQSKSFSQAAKVLGLPNSTVSHKISSLEQRLGVTLIQRTTRKLNITPAGEAYYKKCMQGLEEIKAAELEITATQGEPQGLLRITAPVELGGMTLPEIICRYMNKYPKVRVEVLFTDRVMDLLSENVDLAIRAGDLKDSTLIAKRIGSTYFVPVASKKYLKYHEQVSHPRDLLKHRCLQFTPVGIDHWKMTGPKGSIQAPVPGKFISNHMDMIKKMVMQDHGIAYLPSWFIFDEIKSGKLVRILPEWRSSMTPVHFVYPAQRFVTPKLSAFMEMTIKELRESFQNFEI